MSLGSWERLDLVIKWTGLSVNAFALNIGLKRSETLYQIKKGNHGISRDLAESINATYPQISKAWLLAEEGSMFIENKYHVPQPENVGISLYSSSVELLLNPENITQTPLYNISVPTLNDCDFAITCSTSAMEPFVPNGAIIAVKQVDLEHVSPGRCYLVVMSNNATLRYVRLIPDNTTHFRLVPRNEVDFDEIIIKKTDIKKLYLVQGIIISKIL